MGLKEVFDAFCICDGHMCSGVYQWPWDKVAEGMGWADTSYPPEGGKNTYSLDTKDIVWGLVSLWAQSMDKSKRQRAGQLKVKIHWRRSCKLIQCITLEGHCVYSVEEEWMVIASLFRFLVLERRGDFWGPEE